MKILTLVMAGVLSLQSDAALIRERLDTYLLEYEPQLSALVADERMTQRDGASPDANRQTAEPTRSRMIDSEVAFISLPGRTGWLGFRRVMKVNGKEEKDKGTPLGTLLADGGSDDFDQARLLLADSAGANLGSPRTTNLPNLPLEFLHPRNRHRLHHRIDGREKIRGIETTRMVFEEHSSPTIIQRPEGGDMQSLITAWIEPSTGRLIRARVKTRDARIGVLPFDNIIQVDFRLDEKLGLLVPYEMKEDFFAGRFREGTGTARYSNYRQFRTMTRIVK
jgi:hypothetical protein